MTSGAGSRAGGGVAGRFVVVGADLPNPNRGVQALARSALGLLREAFPGAELVCQGYTGRAESLRLGERVEEVRTTNPTLVMSPPRGLKAVAGSVKGALTGSGRAVLSSWSGVDAVLDISGGDSFATIYGPQKLDLHCRVKEFCLSSGVPLVLLPQTYGPFDTVESVARVKPIVEGASLVATRELHGERELRSTLKLSERTAVHTVPDVAFTMKPYEPTTGGDDPGVKWLREPKGLTVGFNVSSLLWYGKSGFDRDRMGDYEQRAMMLTERLVKQFGATVVLVPHVFTATGGDEKSDATACKELYERLEPGVRERVRCLQTPLDCQELKWLIGRCDAFLGSRMHACIGATSMCVPTVDLAYSKKALGVMSMVGRQDWVVDLRDVDAERMWSVVCELLERRAGLKQDLQVRIPQAAAKVRSFFGSIRLGGARAGAPAA